MEEKALGDEAKESSGSLIGDIGGLGKIGSEIIQAVTRATGALYRPKAIRSEAEARAHEIVLLAEAQSKADAIVRLREDDIDWEIQQRAALRFVKTAVQEQTNLENIVEASLALTHHSADGDAAPIDDGWFARFLDGAKSISHYELQQVWAAILARQARKGNVSLRALDCVRNLDAEDVAAFEKFVWIVRAWSTLLTWPTHFAWTRYHNCSLLSESEEQRLIEAGLIEHTPFMSALSMVSDPAMVTIILVSKRYTMTASGAAITLHRLGYTRVGTELETIVPIASQELMATLTDDAEDFVARVSTSAKREGLDLQLAEQRDGAS